MKNGLAKLVAAIVVTGLMASIAAPQSGPGGRRGPGGGGGGGGGQGGGSREPGGGGQRQDPPQRRNDPPVERRQDPPIERRQDPPIERRQDPPIERRQDPPIERRQDPPVDRRGNPGGGGSGDQGGTRGPGGSRGGGRPDQGGGGGIPGGGTRGSGDQNGGSRGDQGTGSRPGGFGVPDISRGTRPDIRSRTGEGRYGTVNNAGSRGNVSFSRIDRAPVVIDNGVLARRVDRSENISVQINGRGFRVGYYHYNPRWCDDWFVYPHYIFDPWGYQRTCYVSPWYYYVSIPAYIDSSRVIIVNSFPYQNWVGFEYNWRPNYRYDRYDRDDRFNRSNQDLDYALQDLQDAFEREDRRAANRLVPRDGRVNIYTDGRYSYTLGADDFYDLFMDGLYNAKTRRYEIVRVRVSDRGNTARVTARHETTDPWGNSQTVYHEFFLERDGRDYVIREFGTSIEGGRF